MKILLDDCLPFDLRQCFPAHEVQTAQWAGLKGKKNGDLLRAAELAGYDVLLTVDRGMAHQQNLTGRKLAIIIMRSRTNQMEHLLTLVDDIHYALNTISCGQVVLIE